MKKLSVKFYFILLGAAIQNYVTQSSFSSIQYDCKCCHGHPSPLQMICCYRCYSGSRGKQFIINVENSNSMAVNGYK